MKTAKRIVSLLIALMLIFAFAGCGKDEKKEEDDKLAITILYEQDDSMINNYSLLAVNPDAPFVDADGNAVADVKINTVGAKAFIDWMLSDEGFDLIKITDSRSTASICSTLRTTRPVLPPRSPRPPKRRS